MTLIRSAICCALAALLLPSSAQAAPKPPKAETLKKGPITVNPSMGYLLVRLGPKAPEGRGPVTIALAQADPSTGRPYLQKRYAADKYLARTSTAVVYTGRSFLNAAGTGTYVVSLYPGRWYVSVVGNTCMSLGSYAFDVTPGEITDIGTVLTGKEDGKSTVPEIAKARLSRDLVEFGTLTNIVMSDTFVMRAATDGDSLPAEVTGMKVRRAALVDDYRFDNNCRVLIGRAASLPALGHQPPLDRVPNDLLTKK